MTSGNGRGTGEIGGDTLQGMTAFRAEFVKTKALSGNKSGGSCAKLFGRRESALKKSKTHFLISNAEGFTSEKNIVDREWTVELKTDFHSKGTILLRQKRTVWDAGALKKLRDGVENAISRSHARVTETKLFVLSAKAIVVPSTPRRPHRGSGAEAEIQGLQKHSRFAKN